MSRYPQWADYRARTGMLLPRVRRPAASAAAAQAPGGVATASDEDVVAQ